MLVPIPVYAILGHLASGLVILAACEAAYDGHWLINREWTPGAISLCGVTAYALGRLVAVLSRFVLEHWFVPRFLCPPEDVLLANRLLSCRWKRALFANYYRPLAGDVRDQILWTAKADALNEAPRALLIHAQAVAEEDRAMQRRFVTLLQMSGNCRSMCLGLLLVAGILLSGIVWHSLYAGWSQAEWRKLGYCALSLVEAAGMLYRYLKFLRQHTQEVLVSYAFLSASADDVPGNL